MKTTHTIYAGENCNNLAVMSNMAENSVDLIYLDPPFNSKRLYEAPIKSAAEGARFSDKWTMTDVKYTWLAEIAELFPGAAELIRAVGTMQGKLGKKQNNMAAYLIFMGIRLIEMKYLLKPTGAIYLHCDPTAGHGLKLLMDAVFGMKNFRNEIIWHYSGWNKKMQSHFEKRHDTLFYYSKTARPTFHSYAVPWGSEEEYVRTRRQKVHRDSKGKYVLSDAGSGKRMKRYLSDALVYQKPVSDVWVMDKLNNSAKEFVGYPTQKPLALLERIIRASSNPGDLVLDPFCGCATTNVAAAMLGRNSIGIDISVRAGQLIRERLEKHMHEAEGLWRDAKFEFPPKVYGAPPRPGGRRRRPPQLDYITGGPAELTAKQKKNVLDALWATELGQCPVCLRTVDRDFAELDRIVPGKFGGRYEEGNVQFLCRSCNGLKGGRHISNKKLTEERKQQSR